MTSEQYKTVVEALPFGKRLPGAIYVVRPREEDVPGALWGVVQRAETASGRMILGICSSSTRINLPSRS
jgi:hypothetical protein